MAAGLTLVLLCVRPGVARADGGHIALHATSGGCTITLFTAPEPLVTGPVDLSLLVQDAATGAVLDEATASGTLALPGSAPIGFSLTHAGASNKLLLAASPELQRAGRYTLVLGVEQAGGARSQLAGSFSTTLQVGENHHRRTTLLFALGVPLVIVLLFLINQQAKLGRHPPYTRRAI